MKKIMITFILIVVIYFVPVNAIETEQSATDDTNTATYTISDLLDDSAVDFANESKYHKELGTINNKTIQTHFLEQKCDSSNKIVSWASQNPNGTGFVKKTVSQIAADYEKNHSGWKVIGGINADQYTLGFGNGLAVDGKHPYSVQPYYPMIADNYKLFSNTWMHSDLGSNGNFIGYKNDGSVDQLDNINASITPTMLKLSILDEKNQVLHSFEVQKFNENPSDNELSLFTGFYSDTSFGTFLNKSVNFERIYVVESAELAYCNNTSAYINVDKSQNAFFGKGTISKITSSFDLGLRQFAIVSDNSNVNDLLNLDVKILVQYEYVNDDLNKYESAMGYHTVQRNEGIDQTVSGSYNTSDRTRSIIGRKNDGTVVMIVIDDYLDTYGTTGYGINAICKLHNITEAYQMDGGGSAQMTIRQTDGSFRGVSRSADESPNANVGSQRAVMSALLFVVAEADIEINSTVTENSIEMSVDLINKNGIDIKGFCIQFDDEILYFTNNNVKIEDLEPNSSYNYQILYIDSYDNTSNSFYTGVLKTNKREPIFNGFEILSDSTSVTISVDFIDLDSAIISTIVYLDNKMMIFNNNNYIANNSNELYNFNIKYSYRVENDQTTPLKTIELRAIRFKTTFSIEKAENSKQKIFLAILN